MTKRIIPAIQISLFVAFFTFLGVTVRAWSPPTALPPDANVPAPINVGATVQTKTGRLDVVGGVVSGNVVGVTAAVQNISDYWAFLAYGGVGNLYNVQPQNSIGSIYANDILLRSTGTWVSSMRPSCRVFIGSAGADGGGGWSLNSSGGVAQCTPYTTVYGTSGSSGVQVCIECQ